MLVTIGLACVIVAMVGLIAYLLVRLRAHPGAAEAELRPVSDPASCTNCRKFNLAEGQAFLDSYPVARVAYQWVSPRDEARVDPDTVPLRARWEEFGACARHQTVVWGGMIPAQRLTAKDRTQLFETAGESAKERIVSKAFCPDGIDCFEARS